MSEETGCSFDPSNYLVGANDADGFLQGLAAMPGSSPTNSFEENLRRFLEGPLMAPGSSSPTNSCEEIMKRFMEELSNNDHQGGPAMQEIQQQHNSSNNHQQCHTNLDQNGTVASSSFSPDGFHLFKLSTSMSPSSLLQNSSPSYADMSSLNFMDVDTRSMHFNLSPAPPRLHAFRESVLPPPPHAYTFYGSNLYGGQGNDQLEGLNEGGGRLSYQDGDKGDRVTTKTAYIGKREIFTKILSFMDTNVKLLVPHVVLQHFQFPMGEHKINIKATDAIGKQWNFLLVTRRYGYAKPVFVRQWLEFVAAHSLQPGDSVSFYMQQDEAGGVQFSVRVKRGIFGLRVDITGSCEVPLNEGDLKPTGGHVSGSENVGEGSDGLHEQNVEEKKAAKIEPAYNDDGRTVIIDGVKWALCAPNKRKKTSMVWEIFYRVRGENGAIWAICQSCHKKYPAESKNGTTNLRKHSNSCSSKGRRNAAQQSPSDFGSYFDQERSRLDLARMIMRLGCPLDMVQHEFFKTFVHNLQPKFQINSHNTIVSDVLAVYRKEKEKLAKYFDNLSCLFSLSVALQSSDDQSLSCCLTLHFMDDGWVVRKKILAFRNLEPNYDAGTLHETIKSMLMEWHISKNLHFLSVEIAPPNRPLARELKSKLLDQVSHVNGDLLHVSCCAQVFDILIREGFNEIKCVLYKIRASVKYVNETRINRKFQEAMDRLKLQDKKIPSQDDPTRWDTTFLMIESALEIRKAFTLLEQVDSDFTVNPSVEEWDMAIAVCECLKVIHKFICSSLSSIDVYFLNVCCVYNYLLEWEKSEHMCVCSMAKKMKLNLDGYLSEWSMVLGILLVLDPRYKLELVQYGFEQIYGNDTNLRLLKFRDDLTCVYNKYASNTSCLESSATSIGVINRCDPNSDDKIQGFCEWYKRKRDCNMFDAQKSDLDRYLEEPLENLNKVPDVLTWWRVNAPIFPALGKMARDFLAIPVSAILSKPTFGREAMKMDLEFNGLGPEILEALICGADWLESPEKNPLNTGWSKEGKPGAIQVPLDVKCHQPKMQMPKDQAGPFMVVTPTSLEDLKLIEYIFDPSLDGSETVVQCKHHHLTRKELRTLRPQTCLDDNVISVISDVLTLVEWNNGDTVNRYLPISFTEYTGNPSICISFAKKHKIKENYLSALFCCEKMFVPIFEEARQHFYLYVLHLQMQVVEIWDSLAESADVSAVNQRLHDFLVSLDILFEDDILQTCPDGWSFVKFRVERPTNVPQQPNGYDCGVYVIKFMVAPEEVTRPDFVFDSEEERLKVCLRLLDDDVNSCRDTLVIKAEAYQQKLGYQCQKKRRKLLTA